jgi:hypothetical protein
MTITSQHEQEWLDSGIDSEIIALNLVSLSGDLAYEYLLFGLSRNDRRNDGRLRNGWLKQYEHLNDGGWWCSGYDVLTNTDAKWGCFKPDRPRSNHQGKVVKYEHPPRVPTEVFTLNVPLSIWERIAARYHLDFNQNGNFWHWVIEHYQIPILITEGAKKAGALLTAGYVAIALPGINNACSSETSTLIPHLELFCQKWREIVFAFDCDRKWKTVQAVSKAILTTGKLFQEKGCEVFVTQWRYTDGKGVDDLIKNQGVDTWHLVFEPGCKLDTALILQGDQGIGKSSFFSTLGGQWFDDSLQDLSSKDAFLILHKCWIQELGEFERISSKRAAGEIKAFLSRQSDCFRKPYAREAIEYPRTSVLCGSVNKLSFLLDETGNRRFWIIPVGEECKAIDLDLLAKERDGIWAAAVQAYRRGEQWWLTSQEQYLSSVNNERFELVDEWQVEVEHYLDSRDEVSVGEILFNQLNIEPAHQDKPSQMRVAAILTKLGWYKKGRKKHLGKKQIVWSRKKEIVKVESNGVKGVSGAPDPYSTRDTEGHTQDIPSFQEVCLSKNELTGQKIIQDTPDAPKNGGASEKRPLKLLSSKVSSFQDTPPTPFSPLLGKNQKREKGIWGDKPRYVPPDAAFQPNERVIYEQTVYRVRSSTHTHVWLEGIEKAIAIWEVKRIDE